MQTAKALEGYSLRENVSEKPDLRSPSQPITDWPGKSNSGRDAVIAILIPLMLCVFVKWKFNSHDSLMINYKIMLIYLAGLLVGLFVNLALKNKLNSTLGLLRDLPDLDGYAQAVNNIASKGATQEFLRYARSIWFFELLFGLGFMVSGLFNAFFQ